MGRRSSISGGTKIDIKILEKQLLFLPILPMFHIVAHKSRTLTPLESNHRFDFKMCDTFE